MIMFPGLDKGSQLGTGTGRRFLRLRHHPRPLGSHTSPLAAAHECTDFVPSGGCAVLNANMLVYKQPGKKTGMAVVAAGHLVGLGSGMGLPVVRLGLPLCGGLGLGGDTNPKRVAVQNLGRRAASSDWVFGTLAGPGPTIYSRCCRQAQNWPRHRRGRSTMDSVGTRWWTPQCLVDLQPRATLRVCPR